MSRLKDLFNLTNVYRWCTISVSRRQQVDSHCYRTMVVVREIYDKLNGQQSRLRLDRMLTWAMDHDGPESKFGDWPSTSKKYLAGVTDETMKTLFPWYVESRKVTGDVEVDIVHIADLIEALSWISLYGKDEHDAFDGEIIEHKLRGHIHTEAKEVERVHGLTGLYEAVRYVLGEVAS